MDRFARQGGGRGVGPGRRAEVQAAELVPDPVGAVERFHLLREPLELAGLDSVEGVQIESVELLEPYTAGATTQVWLQVRLPGAEAGESGSTESTDRWVALRLEVLHGRGGLRIPRRGRFELSLSAPEPDGGRSAEWFAARGALGDLRMALMKQAPVDLEPLEAQLLPGLELLEVARQVEGWALLAKVYFDRWNSPAGSSEADEEDLFRAAELYERANALNLQSRGKAFREYRSLAGGFETATDLWAIAAECVRLAGESEPEGERRPRLYELAARAGSWRVQTAGSGGLRGPLALSALQCVASSARRPEAGPAAELLRRFVPLEEGSLQREPSELAAEVEVTVPQLASLYFWMAAHGHDEALELHQERLESQRPRPALRIRSIQAAERAALAGALYLRLSGLETAELTDACNALLESLREGD